MPAHPAPPHPAPLAPSLVSRVVVAVMSLLLVGGILVALAAFTYGRIAARQTYDRLLMGAANDIAESIDVVDGAPLADLPVSAFALLALAPRDRIAYALRGPDGTLLTGHDVALPPQALRRQASGQAVFFDAMLNGERARFVTLPRRFAERDYSGTVTVTVGQTIAARNAMALGLTRDALIAATLAGLVLMAIAYVVIRSALHPLREIADGLLARDPYDLTPMATNVPSEVAVMIVAMNRFMTRLDRQFNAMRNLISDTAHQLRTPVAAIRAQAELAVQDGDEAQRKIALERLVARTRSLGNLLDQMLSRAMVIHRTDSAPPEAIDLRMIALEVIESRDHELLAPGVEVGLVIGPDEVIVMGDEISLGEAAKNMLSNALRHGQAPVRIGVTARADHAELWVEDAGPGPQGDLLARMGRRFERSAASRGRSAGLGLSIVRSVAEAFGGQMALGRGERGFRVSLILPAVSGEAN
ncbi:histidine kinase [Thioclava sp. SK-1]|nr:histidine kinase [Thioclava sp. SK-1]